MTEQNYLLNLREGTISFWVRANKLDWGNNKRVTLFEVSKRDGAILIFKDNKNILRVLYQVKPYKKRELSVDVANLSNKKDHQFALTWSQKNNNIILYLDDQKVAETNIK